MRTAVVTILLSVVLLVYWPVLNHDFINFDDNLYITDNYRVRSGLSVDGLIWAFRLNESGYWQPLTWLSHMLDCQIFDLNAGGHHLVNLLLHLANSLLLFLCFYRMTGAFYRSAVVTALFSLHPVNVDSVAWVAERKNLLSTFFWLLTMMSYAYYCAKPGIRGMALTLIAFVLGSLTKPMLVTLPFVLILLDFWPLGRIQIQCLKSSGNAEKKPSISAILRASGLYRAILEKIPFFVLSTLFVIVSVVSLERIELMVATSNVPFKLRIANALVSYVTYIYKMIWPNELAIYYPFPKIVPLWQTLSAALILAAISVMCLVTVKRRPYLFVGWFWYVGTLLPVIGLVQTGLWPATADRWAYIPFIGLFVIASWALSDVIAEFRFRKYGFVAAAVLAVITLAFLARVQVGYWQNSISLFRHTLLVTDDNDIAHNSLATALTKQGELTEAIEHYKSALHVRPGFAQVHNNLGVALVKSGDLAGAASHFRRAIELKPNYVAARTNLGVVLRSQGKLNEAAEHYIEAVRLDPNNAEAYNNLGLLLMQKAKYGMAAKYFQLALENKPDSFKARKNLELVQMKLQDFEDNLEEKF